jgi:hypothetical protein
MELMSERDWKRWDAIDRVRAGKLTKAQAAQICGISVRQLRRLCREVEASGKRALIHGNRGREAPNRVDEEIRERVISLRKGTYAGFNDQHFTEKLWREKPPVEISVRTVRRILRGADIRSVRRRRARQHRKRRERRAQEGLMLLWDGSKHEWLEGRGPALCLMGAIDDATGKLLPGAHFVEQECAAGYLHVLDVIARECGLPWAIYMDRHGSLKRNDDHWTLAEELRGRQDPTQVGMALEALDIEVIYALSPQAKGRVERLWGTLQDRLVSELRLAGASTVEEANAVLETHRLEHNHRFAVPPAQTTSAWRRLRRSVDLERCCSFRYEATVQRDNTVQIAGLVIDIPPGPKKRSYADQRVEVCQLLDRSWRVYLNQRQIAEHEKTGHGELRAIRRRKPSRATLANVSTCTDYQEARP